MRVPTSGGPPQLVLAARGVVDFHCALSPATLCVLGEQSPERKQLTFVSFDPVKGRGGERGGRIVAQGTPEQIAQVTGSYTGQFLKSALSA